MRKTIDQFLVFFKKVKRKQVVVLVPLLFLIFNLAYSQPGTLIEISGQVTDQEKNLPLSDECKMAIPAWLSFIKKMARLL